MSEICDVLLLHAKAPTHHCDNNQKCLPTFPHTPQSSGGASDLEPLLTNLLEAYHPDTEFGCSSSAVLYNLMEHLSWQNFYD